MSYTNNNTHHYNNKFMLKQSDIHKLSFLFVNTSLSLSSRVLLLMFTFYSLYNNVE